MSDLAAHPYTQVGVIIFCVAWFALRLDTGLLTAALSILAISLSQMVLNRQNVREAEAHRRDVAMHAKLDELLIASRRARNEMAGIEEALTEEEIAEIKPHNGDDLRQATERSRHGPPPNAIRPPKGTTRRLKPTRRRLLTFLSLASPIQPCITARC